MKVSGNNVVVYIFDNGSWKPYVCATSAELNVSTEYVETSISGSGVWGTYAPTKNSFTVSMSGVVSLNISGSLSLPDLRQKQITQQKLLMRFQRTDQSGNAYTGVYADELYFFITNSTDSGSFDGMNIFNIAGQGTGAITQIFTPIVPEGCPTPYRYEYTAIGTSTGFTDINLINKVIFEINTDGYGNQVIYSGTPVGNEVRYYQATGQFVWAIPMESGVEVYILYQ